MGKLVRRDCEAEVEADHWLGIGIDRLATDDAVADAAIGEQPDQSVEEIDPVVHYDFPEGWRTHRCVPDGTDLIISGGAHG